MSDIALKLVTTLTNCVIIVDRARHVAPKQPELKPGKQRCLGAFNRWSINVDNSHIINQLKQANVTECSKLLQRLADHAIGQSLWTKTVTINKLFLLFFTLCCYRYHTVFNCCF